LRIFLPRSDWSNKSFFAFSARERKIEIETKIDRRVQQNNTKRILLQKDLCHTHPKLPPVGYKSKTVWSEISVIQRLFPRGLNLFFSSGYIYSPSSLPKIKLTWQQISGTAISFITFVAVN